MGNSMTIDIKKSLPKTHFNTPIFGLHGQYSLAPGIVVPYLNASVELERVVLELKTFDQVPYSIDAVWSLEELYQRDIDYDRIKDEIVNGYLKDPAKLKFFNALTIMLFPKSVSGAAAAEFEDYAGNDPSIPVPDVEFDANFAGSSAKKSVFGGVQYVQENFMGRLRWDMDRVEAVAVDGQHRLCALRKWHESKNSVLTPDEAKTQIPILFLLVHSTVGFKAAQTSSKSLRLIAREIFTDLNKNAKKVDEAREIILDDRSIPALCARKLVTSETGKDSSTLLPLTLVRWQEANNRFDQSYFLNSLLHLHQLVDTVLALKPPRDPLDKSDVEKYIESLDNSLGGENKKLMAGEMSLEQYYHKHYVAADETPYRPFLHLPDQFLRVALEQFDKLHAPYLLKSVLGFKPYRDVLGYARKENLIEGFFGKYHSQPEGHKFEIDAELEKKEPQWHELRIDKHIQEIEKLKGIDKEKAKGLEENDGWAFKAIFQKALVRLMRIVAFEHKSDQERLGSTDDVLTVLDKLQAKGFFQRLYPLPESEFPLWTFLAIHHTSHRIKVNKKIENILTSVLTLVYYQNRKFLADQKSGKKVITDPRALVRYFSSETSKDERPGTEWPGCNGAARSVLDILAENAALWTKISPTLEKTKAEQKKMGGARKRLAAILKEAAVEFAPTVDEGSVPDEDAPDSPPVAPAKDAPKPDVKGVGDPAAASGGKAPGKS